MWRPGGGGTLRPPLSSMVVGLFGACVSVVFLTQDRPVGVDSAVYRAGALAVWHGEALYEPLRAAPYDVQLPFTYPPVAAVVFLPFAVLPTQLAWATMAMLSMLALGVAVRTVLTDICPEWTRSLVVMNGLVLLMLGMQPVRDTLLLGQVNLVLMAMVTLDILAFRTSRFCGVVTGIAAAIKLTPLIFIWHMAITNRRRDAARAFATFAALTVAGAVLLPGDSVRYWTSAMLEGNRNRAAQVANQSLNGALLRITGESGSAMALSLLASVAVVAACAIMAKRLHDQEQPLAALLITAFCGLLVSPISWSHHWVWAVPLCLCLLPLAARGGASPKLALVGVAGVFSVGPVVSRAAAEMAELLAWPLSGFALNNLYLLAAFVMPIGYLLARIARERIVDVKLPTTYLDT